MNFVICSNYRNVKIMSIGLAGQVSGKADGNLHFKGVPVNTGRMKFRDLTYGKGPPGNTKS